MSQRLGSFSSDLVMTQSEALIKGGYMFSYILGIKQLQIKELRHDQMLKTCICPSLSAKRHLKLKPAKGRSGTILAPRNSRVNHCLLCIT